MKTRRHHNNKGHRQIMRGKTVEQVARMAKRLGVRPPASWWCDKCSAEVYSLCCKYCGKREDEES